MRDFATRLFLSDSLRGPLLSSRSIAGADRALCDIEAAMTAILDIPFVDRARVAISGVSRGGALSIAYAGFHPTQIKAVINFVGGVGLIRHPVTFWIPAFAGMTIIGKFYCRSNKVTTTFGVSQCTTNLIVLDSSSLKFSSVLSPRFY